MNECEETKKSLDVFWDTEKADNLPQAIRLHLAQCAECRSYWKRLQSFEIALLQAAQAPSISADAHQRIVQSIKREDSPAPAQPRRAAWFETRLRWLAAAALLILAFGIFHLASNFRAMEREKNKQASASSIQKESTLPLSPSDLATILEPPDVILSAHEDFAWLVQALISHPQSAIRAFSIQTASVNITPVPTPDS